MKFMLGVLAVVFLYGVAFGSLVVWDHYTKVESPTTSPPAVVSATETVWWDEYGRNDARYSVPAVPTQDPNVVLVPNPEDGWYKQATVTPTPSFEKGFYLETQNIWVDKKTGRVFLVLDEKRQGMWVERRSDGRWYSMLEHETD